MSSFFQTIGHSLAYLRSITIMDIIDITIVAALFYLVFAAIRRTKTTRIFEGVFIIIIAVWLSDLLGLHVLNFILTNTMQVGVLALVILFQKEIRHVLERLGSTGNSVFKNFLQKGPGISETVVIQTVQACKKMSEEKTGALIVFEETNKLDEQIRNGTQLDAIVNAELIKNIFFEGAALHDGAMIIRDNRIAAAGCQLPLTNTPLEKELGMRHRAGVGMSEESDAFVIIVSEETGAISVAQNGILKRRVEADVLDQLLRKEFLPNETVQENKILSALRNVKGNVK